MIKTQIADDIRRALGDRLSTQCRIHIETPKSDDHGDFATTLAFNLAKEWKKAPKQIAESVCQLLNEKLQADYHFEPLNGFINIRTTDTFLWKYATTQDNSNYSPSSESILLEFVSANPTGPLHIGHARWAVIGSVLYRLLKATKHTVSSEFYINDAGNQVDRFYESVAAASEGRPIPDDGYHGDYIHELAHSKQDPLQRSIDQQKQTLDRLGVHFDTWFSEKTLHTEPHIDAILDSLKEQDLTYIKDGAVWFKSESLGDDKDRVLIKNDGSYTYFMIDIIYHKDKIKRGYTKLINIWGADHHGYINRMMAAMSALQTHHSTQNTNGSQLTVIIGQLVSLMRGGEHVKMSKRSGDIITLDEVLDDIGPDATRYFLIDKSPDTHIDFDIELAKKKSSENPVFYIQYAYARMQRIFKKITSEISIINTPSIPLEKSEKALLLHCTLFHDACMDAAKKLAPHKVAQYTWQLARYIHHFYETSPILSSEDTTLHQRLNLLTIATSILKKSTDILGIHAPDHM